MTSLESIASSSQIGPPRREAPTVTRAPAPDEQAPVERGTQTELRSRAQRVEAPTHAFQARLNYDRVADEVIVEILNPNTGDVLRRLPAEELPEDIRNLVGRAGPLVETFA